MPGLPLKCAAPVWGFPILSTGYPSSFPTDNIAFLISSDGITFNYPPTGVPVGRFLMNGGASFTIDTEAIDALYYPGPTYNYWVTYEQVGGAPFANFSQLTYGVMGAVAAKGPWNWVADIVVFASTIGNFSTIWDPRWFKDDNGDWYTISNAGNNQTFVGSGLSATLCKANDPGSFTSWGAPTILTVTGFGNVLDATIVSKNNSPLNAYTLFFKDNLGTNQIGWSTSSTLTGTYTTVSGHAPTNDPFGFGACENFHIIKMNDRWRAYASANGAEPTWYVDSFDNWTTWSAKAVCTAPYTGTGGFRVVATMGYPPNNLGP